MLNPKFVDMFDLKSFRSDYGLSMAELSSITKTPKNRLSLVERCIQPITESEAERLIEVYGYSVANYFHKGLTLREEIDKKRSAERQRKMTRTPHSSTHRNSSIDMIVERQKGIVIAA